jgi:hypothetical protein
VHLSGLVFVEGRYCAAAEAVGRTPWELLDAHREFLFAFEAFQLYLDEQSMLAFLPILSD